MPVSPPILVIVFAMALLPIIILALFPVFPKSRSVKLLWIILLCFAIGLFIWAQVFAASDSWVETPALYPAVIVVLFIVVPFSASYILQRMRLMKPHILSSDAAVIVLIAVCAASFFAIKTLNSTCVFFDYNNDTGQAWCPPSWQARR